MQDEVENTTIRRIKNPVPIRKIYKYEENIEDLITNSKPTKEDGKK